MLVDVYGLWLFFFFKQKTAYEMRISDWSSDVCSSDLRRRQRARGHDVLDADAGAAAVEVFEVAGVDVGGADGQPDLLVLVDAVEVDHPLERRAQRAGV